VSREVRKSRPRQLSAEEFRQGLQTLQMTNIQFAEFIGYCRRSVNNWSSGRRGVPLWAGRLLLQAIALIKILGPESQSWLDARILAARGLGTEEYKRAAEMRTGREIGEFKKASLQFGDSP
jgi:hypothetical protein